MPKKENLPAIVQPGTGEAVSVPDFSSIITSESLTIAEKRKKVLEGLGMRTRKKKYESVEERKAASKLRREERKKERLSALAQYGLEPRKKGPRKTKAQKKKARSERGKARREFMREMAKASPDLAKKYGIDPSRFKL